MVSRAACFCLLATISLCSEVFGQTSAKYALLVGVTKYDHAEMKPLEFPEADAKALGDLLKAGGYDVDYLLGNQATQKAIREKLDGLNKKGNAQGVAIVGLFGHGVEAPVRNSKNEFVLDDSGKEITEGCFCPFDTSVRLVRDKKGNAAVNSKGNPLTEPDPDSLIKLAELMNALKVAKSGSRVVFADCCREVPNEARGRSFGASFEARNLPANTSVLFGCSPREKAFEHREWGHGAFTKCLLEELPRLSSQGRVTTGTLIDRLQESVPDLVASVSPQDRQTPMPFFTNTIDLQLGKRLPKPSTPAEIPTKPQIPEVTSRDSFGGKSAGEGKVLVPGMTFRWCPAGDFKMGEDSSAVKVTISSGFWLGETEVTQGQWQSLMTTSPWKDKEYVKEGSKFPATYISHDDAVAYCEKVTEQERKAGRLPVGWKYTLPTEAQWEYACRSGTGTKFSFGDNETSLDDYGWFEGNADKKNEEYAHEAGLKKSNVWGLMDMHGNVWERCADWYGDKLPGGHDPIVLSEGSNRVCRGGGWGSAASRCRSAERSGHEPDDRHSFLGFRVAASSE